MTNPLSLISSAFSTATSFLGGIQTYLIVGAVSAAVAFGGGIWLEHSISAGTINAMKLADSQLALKATQAVAVVQKHEDAVAQASTIKEAAAQTKITVHTVTVTKEIPVHVHDQIACPGPTVGLARLLRAAASGADPDTLQLAPGQSDDACSDVTPTEVAGWFSQYAGAAQANSEQLNALEAHILADHQAQEGAP